ncbi:MULTISPECIES: histone deacetylase [unclassified Pedobacter]|uniref:histone deacetylase family protein n=1 Tax=unclassified Pedobacter TaxID=2628915 RepID=UPI001D83DD0D|nr:MULTISPECIES: histone deacetylase [unclassified Pedobacter]CAH0144372.1 Acetoin utilization protein AcuC [Pedobacter sp. Bi36]CAH0200159.1 Acetoin utilization protein AcuC [Pedobacter sp. Bi126]
MIKIAWHPLYAHPLPEGHRFPMLKYELIPEQLLHEGTIAQQNLFSPEPVSEDIILLTHEKTYWEQLRDLTLSAKDQRRIGFPLNAQLLERELRITQGTIDAAHFAMSNGIAFNVAGGTHHAGSNWGEGFCLLNDQAVAANYLLNKNLAKRILIIDLDVHQGNGTAEIFQKEPRVFTFSMHGDKNFPFRKEISSLDVPLADGVQDEEYLSTLNANLKKAFERAKPDFVFYLSGVDVLSTDKLGKLALSKAACKERDRMVLQACKDKKLAVQVSMGGGYSIDIRDIVDAHCNTYRLAFDLFG